MEKEVFRIREKNGFTLYKNKSEQWVLPFVDFAQWHNKIIIKGINIEL